MRAGSLVAWDGPMGRRAGRSGWSAHTDSPNLRVKQQPDRAVAGLQVVALQPYGGAWLNSWLDRDLGISGRLSVRAGSAIDHVLVRIDDPILRVPQLAIHLAEDRTAVALDPSGTSTRYGLGQTPASFVGFVAQRPVSTRRRARLPT